MIPSVIKSTATCPVVLLLIARMRRHDRMALKGTPNNP